MAQQYGLDVEELRRLVWRNFGAIVRRTGTAGLLPEALARAALHALQ